MSWRGIYIAPKDSLGHIDLITEQTVDFNGADTYTDIGGTYTNGDSQKNFTVNTSTGELTYIGQTGKRFVGIGSADIELDGTGVIERLVTFGLNVDGSIRIETPHTFVKKDSTHSISMNDVITLTNGDVIKVQTKVDVDDVDLIVKNLVVTLAEH